MTQGSTAVLRSCPECGRVVSHRMEREQLRADLSVVWLLVDAAGVVRVRRFCVGCAPRGPVLNVECQGCGDGPLVCAAGPDLPGPVVAWLSAAGWLLDEPVACARCAARSVPVQRRAR